MPARNLAEVVSSLSQIIADCRSTNCSLGYFPILYRRVTLRVKQGIQAGEFEDGLRMERLVVVFANRYLDAYEQFQGKQPCTESWKVAFEADKAGTPIVLQHLLLGINAHINLDLGIAAVEVAGGTPMEAIKRDFDDINRILSELVAEVKMKMGKISLAFKWLMPLARHMDEKLVQFSLKTARDGAWEFAERLRASAEDAVLIATRDRQIYTLGYRLVHPRPRLQGLLRIIAWFEWGSVGSKLGTMEAEDGATLTFAV